MNSLSASSMQPAKPSETDASITLSESTSGLSTLPAIPTPPHEQRQPTEIQDRTVAKLAHPASQVDLRQFPVYEKKLEPHFNSPDSVFTDSLLRVNNARDRGDSKEVRATGTGLYVNMSFMMLLFDLFSKINNLPRAIRNKELQETSPHHSLKSVNIVAPEPLDASLLSETIYLCHIPLLAADSAEIRLQSEISEYNLEKCLQTLFAIEFLTVSNGNHYTACVANAIFEKIEHDWVAAINCCGLPRESSDLILSPDGKEMIRLFALSSCHKREGQSESESESSNESGSESDSIEFGKVPDCQKPSPVDSEKLTDFITATNKTLLEYPGSTRSLKRLQVLLRQLFHLIDDEGVTACLKNQNIPELSLPTVAEQIKYYPVSPEWMLSHQDLGDGLIDDLGYYVIPPFGTYEPMYTPGDYYHVPKPFTEISIAYDIFHVYKDKHHDTLIELRAYTHPSKAGYSIMCVTKNHS